MWPLVLLLSSCFPAGVNAVRTVTGLRGHSVQIHCPYESGYESKTKYLCRGECSVWKTKDIPVDSKSSKDQRFSLKDHTVNRVFVITITDLRTEDAGMYWCAVEGAVRDDYSEIQLQVKFDNSTPPPSDHTQSTSLSNPKGHDPYSNSSSTTLTDQTTVQNPPEHASSDSVMYIGGGLAFVVMVLLVAMTVLYKQKRNTKRKTGEPIPPSVMPADLGKDHRIYPEIEVKEPGVQYTVNMIYGTSDPTNESLYCNVEEPSNVLIYSTPTLSQQSPEQNLYSSVNSTENSTIYSEVTVPK
ncbi:CMRF-35-like molecule 4 [Hoplias malabaricus]|uniref:CMRF-35-like molecule 4 n=1 Tax=Hoplias malabaricus TaxID=27720 RepID=UPI0034633B0C